MTSGRNFDKRDSNKVVASIPNDISAVIKKPVKNENDGGSRKRGKIEIIQPLSVGTELDINTKKEIKKVKEKEKMEVIEDKDDKIIKKVHASLVDEVKKYWHVRRRNSCDGLPEVISKKLQCFGMVQNVKGDSNCGIYAAIEGLLDCFILTTTDVSIFRREVYDYIDKHRCSIFV